VTRRTRVPLLRGFHRWALLPIVAAMIEAPPAVAAQTPDAADDASEVRQIESDRTPWAGDFDGMFERRHIRVLVPYSRTLFFVDKGRERGLTAELARDFERYLNQKYRKKLQRRPITISLIPTTRDKLLSHLVQGLGDISAGNLTITPERLQIADFAGTDRPTVRELLVSGPSSPAIVTLDDLSGRSVDVRRASSYYESLVALNSRLQRMGKPPVKIALLPDALEDEDALEMLNAGLIDFTVVDSWKAKIWGQALPKVRVRQDLELRTEGRVGWAIRRGSPRLQAEIDAFFKREVQKTGVIEYRLAQYERNVKQISANTKGAALKRFEQTLALFEKYGQKYDFDPLMLVAQGYQESRLDQNAKSAVGAVGVMQIMPATGKELNVGNIRALEPNIHAGAKYMDKLMSRYFSDASFSETDRALFAFASYNAGPGSISRMRRMAKQRGLDPNQWFNNVELVVAQKIGIETTTYVRNIFKYYVAYKLTLEAHEAQTKARQGVTAGERGTTP
jgi:membrane-bound lytic murein transglycosylase MltF